MAIAWGIEGHLVKADYMAALITAMMATDRFFDHVTNLLFETIFEPILYIMFFSNRLFLLYKSSLKNKL